MPSTPRVLSFTWSETRRPTSAKVYATATGTVVGLSGWPTGRMILYERKLPLASPQMLPVLAMNCGVEK
jgi:hypothetical protein